MAPKLAPVADDGVKLRFIRGERGNRYLAITNLNDLRVEPLLLEKAQVFGDENITGALVETGKHEHDFVQRRGRARGGNDRKQNKYSAEQSLQGSVGKHN